MRKLAISLIAILLMAVAGKLMAIEEARYTVTSQQDTLELREYAPAIVAEVIVEDDFESASSEAFRKLFNYISGDNNGSDKIAMTAPVTQKAVGW